MNKKAKKASQYILFLLIGVFLLWLCFRNIDLKSTWSDIQTARYGWMFLSLIFLFIALYIRALRWNLMIDSLGYKTRSATTFYAVLIAYMANLAIPRIGEIVRCGALAKKEKIPFDKSFGTVISERVFDVLFLLLLALLVVIFQWKLLGNMVYQWFKPMINFAQEKSLLLILLLIVFIGALVGAILLLKRQSQHKVTGKLWSFFSSMMDGIKSIWKMKSKGLFIVYTLLIWALYVPMTYLPFLMFDETSVLTMIDALTLLGISTIGFAVPVPGGIGAYHGLVMILLPVLNEGITAAKALSFATINHAVQSLFYIVTGAIAYLIMFFIDKKEPLNEPLTKD